jgi:diguanylate cyclase (GGDEF)-like protein
LTNQEAELLTKEGKIVKTIYSATIAENDAYGFMGIIVSFHDVTAQKELEKKLFTLAHYDALTELPNRRYFLDMLYSFEELYLKGNPDFAILFIDLDGFKEINDAMGHDVGDQLLVAIGARLNACVEDADIVARIGGDEFVILQGNVKNERDIHKRQAIILNQFKRPIQIENHKCSVGLSIGYSRYSEMKNIPDMMREADRRMYAEKAKHTFQQDHH